MNSVSIIHGGQRVKLLPMGVCRVIDGERTRLGINPDMERYFGKDVTIDFTTSLGRFRILKDYNCYVWSEAWIDYASTFPDLFVKKQEVQV